MDKLVEFLISNLQPAIDSIKAAAPDVIAREARWLAWAYTFTLNLGIAFAVATGLLIAGRIYIAINGDDPHGYSGWSICMVVFAVLFAVTAFVLIIVGAVELKHLELNPTYVLLRHFTGH